MYIAQNKRRENIAEYILYLWQLEDLLRAMQLSPEAIYATLVKPRGLERSKEEELMEWYLQLADLLEREEKQEHGHLEHTMHLVDDLHRLHVQLLELPVGKRYRSLYARLAPELERLRQAIGKPEMSDTELSMRALYAVMLHRIKGDQAEKQGYIDDVLETVSPVIAELASIFRQVEEGEIDLFRGE